MAASDETFQLVKSLSKSEKRFFRLFSSITEGKKNYIRIFDLMDAMDEFDPDKLKTKTRPMRINLSHEKIYLRNQILRAMRNFHSASSPVVSLRNRMLEIAFLYDKGLDALCRTLVEKGIEEAEACNDTYSLLQLITWKRLLADRTSDFASLAGYIQHDHLKEKELLLALQQDSEYTALYLRMMEIVKRRGLSPDNEFLSSMQQIRQDPLLAVKQVPQSFEAKKYYYAILSTYCQVTGDIPKSLSYLEVLIDEIEKKHSDSIRNTPKSYFGILNNFLGRCIYAEEEKLFFTALGKLRHLPAMLEPAKRKLYEEKVFLNSSQLELEFSVFRGDYATALQRLPEIIRGLNALKHPDPIIHVTLLYTIAAVYFGAENYEQTLVWLNKVIHDRRFDSIREDIQVFARFMKLVVYFETGDQKGLELALRTFGKYIEKTGKMLRTGQLMHDFFHTVSKMPSKPKLQDLLVKTRNELHALQADKKEKILEQYFEFGAWLDGKISGKSLASVIRSRFNPK